MRKIIKSDFEKVTEKTTYNLVVFFVTFLAAVDVTYLY